MPSITHSGKRALIIALCLGLLIVALGAMTVAAAPTCTTDCYVNPAGDDNNAGDSANPLKTIQAGVNAVAAGGTVHVAAGEYVENVTINKSLTLSGAGQADDPLTGTILDGSTLTGKGISIASGVTNVTIENLRVEDYKNAASAGIHANAQNHNFTVQNVTVDNNGAAGGSFGGVYMNGPVNNVLIDHVTATNNVTRGIVIWNGFKTNITITNNTVTNNNCCGIELQDGTASGVTVTGNTVSNNADSGMAFTGLTSGAGANRIANNTLDSNGRFGIEIKLPNGTGLTSGDGSIVVENNIVSLTTPHATDLRDWAGIAAYRRGWVTGNNNVDIPTGVVIRNNTVSGYQQNNTGSFSTGFGIVVEGTNMTVTGNTLNNNEVGVQRQGGHLPYTPNTNVDGNQNNLDDDFFGRGNSPVGCATVSGNNFSGNGENYRTVSNGPGGPCGPQVKITSPDTLVCDGGGSLSVDFSDVPNLYGYEFKVSYDQSMVNATGAFVNSWFNTVGAFVPPGWNAACSGGSCQFAASLINPNPAVNGDGTVATINFAMAGGAGGTFTPAISDLVLTDRDGFPITATINTATPEFTACGTTTVSGKVSLQGRTSPGDAFGVIKLVSPDFPATTGSFDANGNFSIPNVPAHPSGSAYTLQATHILYVGNSKDLTLTPGTSAGHNTTLRGGDANNGGLNPPFDIPPGHPTAADTGVNITDLTCIGGSFGLGVGACGSLPDSSTDINADLKTNIQDLSLAAGNFDVHPFQPW